MFRGIAAHNSKYLVTFISQISRQRFQSFRCVHYIPDNCVVDTSRRSDIPNYDPATVDPDAEFERREANARATGVISLDRLANSNACATGSLCMVTLRFHAAPERHHRISDVLVQNSMLCFHALVNEGKVVIKKFCNFRRR